MLLDVASITKQLSINTEQLELVHVSPITRAPEEIRKCEVPMCDCELWLLMTNTHGYPSNRHSILKILQLHPVLAYQEYE